MLFYLVNYEIGKISLLFEFGYIIFRGWGKSPLLLAILIYHINKIFILVYCRMSLHTCNVYNYREYAE